MKFNRTQRKILADRFLELANLGMVSLVFVQVFSKEALRWDAIFLAVVLYIVTIALAISLTKEVLS